MSLEVNPACLWPDKSVRWTK
ncbi:hypothetical protein [Brevibacillus borstelensis]